MDREGQWEEAMMDKIKTSSEMINQNEFPRVLLAGTNSGCGKTTVTCALLGALRGTGRVIQAFKCGPDYIDPMFHRTITDRHSRNLDSFLLDRGTVKWLLYQGGQGADLSVLEGVMGFYDGLGGQRTEGSTYEVAEFTRTPVLLVVNSAGMSLSAVALIKGYMDFRPGNQIQGVIFNQVSAGSYSLLKTLVEDQLHIKVYGYLPKMPDCALESRHLGLIPAEELEELESVMERLAKQGRDTLDLVGICKLAAQAEPMDVQPPDFLIKLGQTRRPTVNIAVAKDQAFCFYYQDNLELLERLGASLTFFSPLEDKALPENIHGLYLGGGYPEIFASKLAANVTMKTSIKAALAGGLPCWAECGGFMYLTHKLHLLDGTEWDMVGYLPGESRMTEGLKRFGYIDLTANEDSLLAKQGARIRGHEFHYSDADHCGTGFKAEKPVGNKMWECFHVSPVLMAGYPHLHLWGNPDFARNFISQSIRFKEGSEGGSVL